MPINRTQTASARANTKGGTVKKIVGKIAVPASSPASSPNLPPGSSRPGGSPPPKLVAEKLGEVGRWQRMSTLMSIYEHSITPPLHDSTIPPLHHSITKQIHAGQ